MERSSLRLRHWRLGRIAVALGITATTVPVVLGVLANPSAAATSSTSSTITAQELVADVECDAGWLLWDLETYNLGLGGVPTPPPFCEPVPPQLAGL